ncbi:tetratricopeptide repeat-containing sensor histidine kinase [Pedobacter sp.]
MKINATYLNKYIFTLLLILLTNAIIYAQQQNDTVLDELAQKIEKASETNSDSLEYYVLKGVQLAEKLQKKQKVIRFKHLLGLKAFKESNYKKAVENYLSAIRIGDNENPAPEYIRVLYDASEVYRKINKDTSMNFVRKGLNLAQSLKHKELIGDGFNRLGYAFEIRSKKDSALYYYKKGLDINLELKNKIGASYAYESLAGIFSQEKDYKKAVAYLKIGYQLRKEVNDKFAQSISLINLAETYKSLKKTDSTLFYAQKALQLASEIKYLDLVSYCNSFISNLYKERGDYKNALIYKEQGYAVQDSIFNAEKSKQITELDKKYQTEKHQQQIKILGQNAVINNLKIRQRNILLFVLGFTIIAGAIISYFIFNRRKLKAKAELQAEVIKQQDIASKAVLDAEERERRRIAGDLHDGVGQMLSAALMNLNGLFSKLNLPNDTNLQAEKALALVNESYDEMRSISHQMMPNALIKSGLASAVKEFIGKLDKDKLKVTLETAGLNQRLDEQTETVIYRIIQETVTNVVKHANASKLDIQIIKDDDGIAFTIEDNGKGFNKNDVKAGIGLSNIYSRVEFLKGTVDIDSTEGKGTLVAIHLPN